MDLKAPWVKIVLFVAAVVFLGFGAAHVAWSGPSAEDTELRRVVLEEVAVAVLDKGTATTDNGKLIENLNEDYRSQSKGKADAPPSEPKPDAEDPEFEWVEEDVIEYVDKDEWVYEDVVTLVRYTTRGCRCAAQWTHRGKECAEGCCNFDDDEGGEWCAVEDPVACRQTTGAPQPWGYCLKKGVDPATNQGESALTAAESRTKPVGVSTLYKS